MQLCDGICLVGHQMCDTENSIEKTSELLSEDTIQEEVEDNITTDVEETLSALNTVPGFGYCNSPELIEWFQRDELSSNGYCADVTCASNNELIEKRI